MPCDTRDVADVTADPAASATGKTAVLYRMALPNHLCPSGQKARWLLERKGYEVDGAVAEATATTIQVRLASGGPQRFNHGAFLFVAFR